MSRIATKLFRTSKIAAAATVAGVLAAPVAHSVSFTPDRVLFEIPFQPNLFTPDEQSNAAFARAWSEVKGRNFCVVIQVFVEGYPSAIERSPTQSAELVVAREQAVRSLLLSEGVPPSSIIVASLNSFTPPFNRAEGGGVFVEVLAQPASRLCDSPLGPSGLRFQR